MPRGVSRLLAMGVGALLLTCGLALPEAAARAATVETSGAAQCDAKGFSIDADPKGTNVRSAPRVNAPVIGRLAPLAYPGGDKSAGVLVGPEFEIVGAKDGWLLIQRPGDSDDFKLDAAYAAEGRGWISGRLVGTQLGAQSLRAAPRRDAPIVTRMRGENWGPDSVKVAAVHACQDKYVEVTATPPGGKSVRGWSWMPCSSQLTTCDRGGEQLDN
jgi:hypothetical protein